MKSGYKWHPPKLHQGQDATFVNHRGHVRIGRCARIETHYSDGVARHSYAMYEPGHKLAQHVGDNDIMSANA